MFFSFGVILWKTEAYIYTNFLNTNGASIKIHVKKPHQYYSLKAIS